MSGIGFSEFLILCMIGLIVLGPKRLPKAANQIGTWIGQARRMTRVMRRQLEEELDFDREFNIKPSIKQAGHPPPRDDDGYSPQHESSAEASENAEINASEAESPANENAGEVDEPAFEKSNEIDRGERREA